MRYRNFSMEEAMRMNGLMKDLLPVIQSMPLGKTIRSMSLTVDEDMEYKNSFVALKIEVQGRLSDTHACRLLALADEFPERVVAGGTCNERFGVRGEVLYRLRTTTVIFRWVGLRAIDRVKLYDYYYRDGSFSHSLIENRKVVGVVYYVDNERIRIISASPVGKHAWAVKDAPAFSDQCPEINPCGIFERSLALHDINRAMAELMEQAVKYSPSLKSYPALSCIRKHPKNLPDGVSWCLPEPGDAVYIFGIPSRKELSARLKKAGGTGLSNSGWLDVPYAPDKAYIVKPTSLNAFLQTMPVTKAFQVYPIAEMDWKTIEQLKQDKQ